MQGASSPDSRLRLLDAVGSCSSFALVADRLLEPLSSALGASSSVFLEFVDRPGAGLDLGRRAYVGARPWSADAYAERYFRVDPLFERVCRAPRRDDGDDPARVDALPETGDVRGSDYYRRFLHPSDIAHVAGIAVPFRSGLARRMLCLGFHRSHGRDAFGAVELGTLRQFSPVLCAILSGLAARDALLLSDALVDRIVQMHQGSGYLVFDDDLMLLLTGGGAAQDLGFVNPDSHANLLGELRARLLTQTPDSDDSPLRFTLRRPTDDAAVEIEVQRLATGSGQRLIVTTRAAPPRSPAQACCRWGLSAREHEVARLVCVGSSNTEIARTLGISIRTVENHLRSIYAKAGVGSRTQLAARALL